MNKKYNLYTNTVLCGSVILSVRYRNHFPVVQFQNQAHIWNPQGAGHVFKTIRGENNHLITFTRASSYKCLAFSY